MGIGFGDQVVFRSQVDFEGVVGQSLKEREEM